jgi:hypothetical protein
MNMTGKYTSELAAKRASGKTEGYCIVEFRNGSERTYDYFPQGHPIGEFQDTERGRQFVKATNHTIICRAYKQANGKIVWR